MRERVKPDLKNREREFSWCVNSTGALHIFSCHKKGFGEARESGVVRELYSCSLDTYNDRFYDDNYNSDDMRNNSNDKLFMI